jgi:hypothetical protein
MACSRCGDTAAAAAAAAVPDLDCPICLDAYDRPVMTACHHWFCKECILGVRGAGGGACACGERGSETRLGGGKG